MSNRDAVRSYYTALDDQLYETFERLLTEEFVHQRPDRTLEGRGEFVKFMREERPLHTTTHDIREFYSNDAGDELVVRGVLRDEDGNHLFTFMDRHVFDEDRISRLETFTLR
jgi:ketosteroid isomerase-like protein